MPHDVITPNLLIEAYSSGLFPMAEGRDDKELFWVDPEERGVIPLDDFHIPRSLAKHLRQDHFQVTIDTAFNDVVKSCSKPARGRETTWISERIETLYTDLFNRGFAHSVEVWVEEKLVGGLYGVSLNGAFFGESMFSTETNASKTALVYLIAQLKAGGYFLLDTQFITDHLRQFGAREISREEYRMRLDYALRRDRTAFGQFSLPASGAEVLQFITQTS
ncbi:MAG: leucyl/phenylalanyl-tRNA--protein transferase [Kordiimonadales bacterium]|nr:MAG: leucyl/phenylalanyl-tRNA--protein transferase [Kordiimonadales bacterium]